MVLILYILQLLQSLQDDTLTMEHIKKNLKKYASSSANLDEIISEDSEYNFGSQLAEEFVSKLGTNKYPQVVQVINRNKTKRYNGCLLTVSMCF